MASVWTSIVQQQVAELDEILEGPRDENGLLLDKEAASSILWRARNLAQATAHLAVELDQRVSMLESLPGPGGV